MAEETLEISNPEIKPSTWLADDLIQALYNVPGSNEREHIMLLMRRAHRFMIDSSVSDAASRTIRDACPSIERHLDLLAIPAPVCWFEYPHADRVAAFRDAIGAQEHHGDVPETIGCLVAQNPQSPDHVTAFVAWRMKSGKIYNSYALLHWSLSRLAEVARLARSHTVLRSQEEAAATIFDAATVFIPPGMLTELEIWQGHLAANDPRRNQALDQARRDASGEHLFLLTLMMLFSADVLDIDLFVDPKAKKPEIAQNDEPTEAGDEDDKKLTISRHPQMPHFFSVRLAKAPIRYPWEKDGFGTSLLNKKLIWLPPKAA